MRFRQKPDMLIWVLLGIIALMAAWKWECHEYDRDLERDFTRETGKTYKEISNERRASQSNTQ